MKFIDFHTHVYPEKIAVKATQNLSSSFGKDGEWPATAENLVIFEKAAGIEKSVILPVAIKEAQVRKINEFAVSAKTEFSEHIIGFGALHAAQENLIEEIDFIKNSGLKGIKIHPDQQLFPIDDQRLFDAYKYLSELQIPVLFHCGSKTSDLSHPSRLKNLAKLFPELKIVGAHFGGWTIFDEAYELVRNENIHFDMSSSIYIMGTEKTAKFINDYGVGKIFFGTDFPLSDPIEEIKKFLSLNISDDAKEKIAYKNACDFLNITL